MHDIDVHGDKEPLSYLKNYPSANLNPMLHDFRKNIAFLMEEWSFWYDQRVDKDQYAALVEWAYQKKTELLEECLCHCQFFNHKTHID